MDTVNTDSRRKPKIPDGYDSSQEFLKEMRQRYDRAIDADDHNRTAAVQDIEFTYGEQWDQVVRASREKRRKPVLTINRLPAYVAQIVNNRLLNSTEIRVLPDREGTKEIAELRQGIIRSIFKNSESDFARDEAMKYQVICGIGAFHMCLEYTSDDAFEQDVHIKPIVDPLSVVFDEMSVLPDGGDANHAFVMDNLPRDIFKARYPWASMTDFDGSMHTRAHEWFSQDAIKLVSYWRMVDVGERTLALMTDGTTKEIDPEMVEPMLAQQTIAVRADGTPYVKTSPRRMAEMYLCSGADLLEGPYRLPVSSIPVYRVPGWEIRNGDKVYRWGLVRFLKDPQRLHNYWRSTIAEQLVAAPRNKWVATNEAVSGREKQWRQSHIDDDPLLIYNAEGGKPERVAPPAADGALLTEAASSVQDIRDVSNIHEAALGIKSNEVSGKALQMRQQMTDLASFIYHDRLRMAEERCAKNINEIIPTVFDTVRIATILGQDDEAVQVVLNDPSDPNSDVTLGKYGVTVTTGPSTVTKRTMVREEMIDLLSRMPEQTAAYMDLIVDLLDVPGRAKWVKRAKALMPQNLQDEQDMTPEQQEAQAAEAEKQQMVEQIELMKAQAEIENVKAQALERQARAQNLLAQAGKNESDAKARADDVEGKNLERDMSARMRVVEAAIAAGAQNDGGDDD